MSSPQRYINRMIVFLVLSAIAVASAYEILFRIFMYNPLLNGLILGVLLVGIVYIFRRVFSLKPEIRWIEAFRTSKPGLLAAGGAAAAGAGRIRARRAGTPRPVHAAGDVGALSAGQHQRPARRKPRHLPLPDRAADLPRPARHLLGPARDDRLGRRGDQRPVGRRGRSGDRVRRAQGRVSPRPWRGMGTAFGSSLFGLAGSLVLGFLDLQATQAQNSFYNDDRGVALRADPAGAAPSRCMGGGDVNIPAYVQALLEQTAENLEGLQRSVARSEENQATVHSGLIALTERLSALGDQIATEQALLARLISSQEELRPVLGPTGRGRRRRSTRRPATTSATWTSISPACSTRRCRAAAR